MKTIILSFLFLLSTGGAVAQIDNLKALNMALDDEYKAYATYEQVINDFGSIRPFSRIVQSEARHIEALRPFYTKYNAVMPQNDYLGNITSYNSVSEACQAGVKAEIENVKLYDKIYGLADDPELISVFKRLQWASQERHLRAFKRCAR